MKMKDLFEFDKLSVIFGGENKHREYIKDFKSKKSRNKIYTKTVDNDGNINYTSVDGQSGMTIKLVAQKNFVQILKFSLHGVHPDSVFAVTVMKKMIKLADSQGVILASKANRDLISFFRRYKFKASKNNLVVRTPE